MVARNIERRRLAAIARENVARAAVDRRATWEQFRDQRIAALKHTLGRFPTSPKELKQKVTGRIRGDGFVIEKIVFESRPGLLVTGNLYLPAEAGSWTGSTEKYQRKNGRATSRQREVLIGKSKRGNRW